MITICLWICLYFRLFYMQCNNIKGSVPFGSVFIKNCVRRSKTKPHDVTTKLMRFNIIVDAIVVGKVDNHMLHGISNATGIMSNV